MDKFAEQSVAEIERRIRKIYSQAAAEITEDMDKYLQKYRKKDAMLRAKVLKGEITEDEYRRWKQGQVFAGDRWKARQRKASGTLLMANQKANAIVEGKRLEVFQDGANYQAYEFERDTGIGIDFDLLNEQAVERLIRDEPELLPRREMDKDKDRGWNQTNIANAVTQSILQGESMEEAAKRIGRDTGITNEKAMMRYARTAVNGAENAGSLQGLREIQAMGIHVMKQWVATLDSKTRDAHQDLDGQVAELDESFESQLGPINYPGDPSAEPGNVYNCRCTIKAYYPGYADMIGAERQRRAYEDPKSVLVGDMTYKEWKAAKGKTRTYAEWDPEAARKTVEHPVQSKRVDYDGGNELIERERQEPKNRPKHAQFTPATTIQEAEEYAQRFLGYNGKVSYKGIGLEYANICNKVLTEIQSNFDVSGLGTVGAMNMRSKDFKGTTSEAAYRWGTKDLYINPTYYKTRAALEAHIAEIKGLTESILRNGQALKDSGKITGARLRHLEAFMQTGRQCVSQSYDFAEGTFIHENGHRLDDAIFMRELRTAFGVTNIGYRDRLAESMQKYGSQISAYAVSDTREYIAESFTAWWYGEGDKCDPIIVEVFERTMKK